VREETVAVSRHHDQVRASFLGQADDFQVRGSVSELDVDVITQVSPKVGQALTGALFQALQDVCEAGIGDNEWREPIFEAVDEDDLRLESVSQLSGQGKSLLGSF
jgi:hypothetical protein